MSINESGHVVLAALLVAVMSVGAGVGVTAQTSSSPSPTAPSSSPSPAPSSNPLALLYSQPPGAWLVTDNSSTALANKTQVVSLGMLTILAGGPHAAQVMPQAMPKTWPVVSPSWCSAAGYVMAMYDTNSNPDILPQHRLQLVFSNDEYDSVKAFSVAQDVYSLPRSDSPLQLTDPVELVAGGSTFDIARSEAAVALHYNRPFIATSTDSSLLPAMTYPTLVSTQPWLDVLGSAAAQFAYAAGWARVATLTSLDTDAVADASHFSRAATSLGITVASRETFDESYAAVPSQFNGNPTLDAAVARLRALDIRIIYIGCPSGGPYAILFALDRAGMIGARYVVLAGNCMTGISYVTQPSISPQQKAHLLSSTIDVQPNTFIPDDAARVADFLKHAQARYQQAPISLYACDPSNPTNANILRTGYDQATVAIQGLHLLYQRKAECQLPANQQALDQAMPLAQVQQMRAKGSFDCTTAMAASPWNTSLAIDCCRLDASRTPYTRPTDPFGSEAYVGGSGPVLLDMLRSVRMEGVAGEIGIQTPSAPVANLAVVTYPVDPNTGHINPTVRMLYKTTSCNATTNVCVWNATNVSPITYGDGATVPPDDGVIRYIATIHPSTAGRAVFVAFAVLGMLACGVVSVLMWRNRQLKSIKSSSITFVMLILFAAAAALSTIITLYHDDQAASCQARIWMGHLSFTILFGSLLLKTFRLASIFDNRALRVKTVSDLHLLGLLSIYVAVVCAVLISWMVRHAPTVVFKLQSDGRAGYYTCQSSSYTEMWVLLGLHAAALLWGIYLCVKSQDVFAELNESKQIASSIYQVSLLSALIVAIDQGLDYFNVDVTFFVYACGILLGAVTTVSLLTVPKMLDIHRHLTKRGSSHGVVQRQYHTKENDSGPGNGSQGDVSTHGKDRKRSSFGRRTSTDSTRVSDLGLGVTPADWMKLNVFTRKCHEASTNNNIGRLMMEHNKVFTLLMQIYKEAKAPTAGSAPANTESTQPAPATAPTTTTATSSSTLPSRSSSITSIPAGAGTNRLGFIRHRGSQSAEPGLRLGTAGVVPFDVNEGGVKLQSGGSAQVQELFNMHQQRAGKALAGTPNPALAPLADPVHAKPDISISIDTQSVPDTNAGATHSQARLFSPVESPTGPISGSASGLDAELTAHAHAHAHAHAGSSISSGGSDMPRNTPPQHQHQDMNQI